MSETENNQIKTKMKVKELIALLKEMNPDAGVVLAAPSHDHWRTELALCPREVVAQEIKYSDYHEQFVTIPEENEEPNAKLKTTAIVIR